MGAPRLYDPCRRHIHKLRVQLTDACDFRCFYCMPEDVRFMPSAALMSVEETLEICRRLTACGIDEMRVSGGEPLVRRECRRIIAGLSELPLRRLGLTTNGRRLKAFLPFLRTTRCRHINVSLDSLDPLRFARITRGGEFTRTRDAILAARDAGMRVKVNMVVMRDVNDDEVFAFLDFSAREDVEVRFLELMKIGCARLDHERRFVPADEVIRRIEARHRLRPVSVNADSTAFNFLTDHGARVGFIASESRPFCEACSRLRLTADGRLRACLMRTDGLSLRGVPAEDYPRILREVMAMKPTGRVEEIAQPMYRIGG